MSCCPWNYDFQVMTDKNSCSVGRLVSRRHNACVTHQSTSRNFFDASLWTPIVVSCPVCVSAHHWRHLFSWSLFFVVLCFRGTRFGTGFVTDNAQTSSPSQWSLMTWLQRSLKTFIHFIHATTTSSTWHPKPIETRSSRMQRHAFLLSNRYTTSLAKLPWTAHHSLLAAVKCSMKFNELCWKLNPPASLAAYTSMYTSF